MHINNYKSKLHLQSTLFQTQNQLIHFVTFTLGSDEEEEVSAEVRVPKVFLVFDKPLKLQLRTYIYQARDLPAMDQDGTAGTTALQVFQIIVQTFAYWLVSMN